MILIVRALSYFGSRHLTFYIMNGVSNQNGWAMHDHSNVTDSNLHQQVLVTVQMQRMSFTMMNKCFDLNNHNYNCSEYVSHQILSSMIKIEDIDSHILRLVLKGQKDIFVHILCFSLNFVVVHLLLPLLLLSLFFLFLFLLIIIIIPRLDILKAHIFNPFYIV